MLRLGIYAVLILLAACFVGYTIALAQRVTVVQKELVTNKALIDDLTRKCTVLNTDTANRLSVLEAAVYGPQRIQTVNEAAVWQKNRDADLRKRLGALERWRLEVGKD